MAELIEAITVALSSGTNPVTAIREATGYTIEQLAVTSGLAEAELVDLEAGSVDQVRLTRLASALGLPESVVTQ
ncbi:MAG: helix-turn-helix domain-containing protein [Neoaquamicrobium sediminum]|uniref:helix-turn-helix domain-containing protein n=1 Tax=Neoaquamicrobium sediminum TaxID=1849104 RepID=UPI001DE7AE34|nr:helix-turn-helix transcriptional regulator [Mesorhizobium sp.]